MIRWIWSAVFAFAVIPASLAQDGPSQAQMEQWLASALHRSQITSEGMTPFHLVATYEQFDLSGKVIGKGSLDELWVNPKRYRELLTVPEMRKVITTSGTSYQQDLNGPPRHLVEVDNGVQAWRTGEWVVSGDVVSPILQPLSTTLLSDGTLSTQPAPAGNAELQCVGWSPELDEVPKGTPVALTTICMSEGNHLLKLINRPDGRATTFSDTQPFAGKYIARSIQTYFRNKVVLSIHLVTLEAATGTEALDVPPPAEAQVLSFHRADQPFTTGERMVGQLLTKVPVPFPQEGLGGAVVVRFQVDTSGYVTSEQVLSADNPLLRAPVLTALKSWRFRVSYQRSTPIAVDHVYRFTFDKEEQLQ